MTRCKWCGCQIDPTEGFTLCEECRVEEQKELDAEYISGPRIIDEMTLAKIYNEGLLE
jgi:hypothetical protein